MTVDDNNTRCWDCPLRKTGAFSTNTPDEIDFIQGFKRRERTIPAGTAIIHESEQHEGLFTLLSGWAFRYRTLSDGRRQILNFCLPGDFLGLQEQMAVVSPHGVEALTDVRACVFEREELWSLYRGFPGLGFDVTWLAAHEEHIVDDNLLSVGQRSAQERIAMLLLNLYKRANALDMVDDDGMVFPVTQQHIADALGLSLVHTNKTLRVLQRVGLHQLSKGRLKLTNPHALERLADYYEIPLRGRPLI
jgi:CRP/FNR family transcriptional regulator